MRLLNVTDVLVYISNGTAIVVIVGASLID